MVRRSFLLPHHTTKRKELVDEMIIVCDNREQHPLTFRKSKWVEGTVIKKLDVGDYSILGEEDKIAIERKNPADLFGTLGKGHSRFKRELERAQKLDFFAVVVEATWTDIVNKSFEGAHYIGMRGDVVGQICATLAVKYGIFFFFCKDRVEAVSIIRALFKAYMKLKQVREK